MNRRVIRWLAALLFLALIFWLFPPFHIVRLGSEHTKPATNFNPAEFATNFWHAKLLPACDKAPQLKELLQLLNHDPAAARQQFGHSPGLSSTTLFLVQGTGHVTALEKEEIRVEAQGSGSNVQVALLTGLVFGNAVRDASGLLDGSAFANSQDFNDISTELNSIVEKRVVPDLRGHAAPRKAIRFAGCIELEEGSLPKVWQLTPIKVEWP
jgi:predicted lipoprotein